MHVVSQLALLFTDWLADSWPAPLTDVFDSMLNSFGSVFLAPAHGIVVTGD